MKAFLAAAVVVASVPFATAIAAGPDTKASGNQGDERVCRVIRDRNSASRMGPRRLCMTRRQWNQVHDGAAEDGMEQLSTRTQALGSPANGVTPRGGMPR